MPLTTEVLPGTPLRKLPGVGPERAALLGRLHLATVEDLLLHRPRRYEDRRHLRTIGQLELGQSATTHGRIVAQGIKRFRRGTRSLFELILEDGTGRLHCRWWNQPYMEKHFEAGNELLVFGRLKDLKPRTIDHPETEVLEAGEEISIHLGRIVPIYPATEGLSQRWLRALVFRTLMHVSGNLPELWPELKLPDLPARAQAIQLIHFPAEPADADKARERLALDEFLALQVEICRRRRNLQTKGKACACGGDNRWIKPFLAGLGFPLTAAQTRVLREIRQDLRGPHPMRRLVQGDVGSGKTVVAACAILMALESGFNAALMAPTEILAEQHFQTFRRWLEPLGLKIELQTGTRKTRSMPEAQWELGARPSAGPVLFIGTHALLTAAFAMPNLGLVLIDEQHKFGVAQREQLVRKGRYPHLLVLTATPIPRTLGLTVYGDLEVSTIDELPPGRGRVRTFVRGQEQLGKVHAFLKDQLRLGRQAYVVFSRVDEEDTTAGLKAVTREWERLRQEFAPYEVGLLHGQLRWEERERVMTAFRNGELSALMATSVIEVGVDVPNATVMVIENADRFGLAQLHQLRGRIGRGTGEAFCILMAEAKTKAARERLDVLVTAADGFAIAEADLRLRGPGDLLGQNQSGLPPLRFGDLATDAALIERARALAPQCL